METLETTTGMLGKLAVLVLFELVLGEFPLDSLDFQALSYLSSHLLYP